MRSLISIGLSVTPPPADRHGQDPAAASVGRRHAVDCDAGVGRSLPTIDRPPHVATAGARVCLQRVRARSEPGAHLAPSPGKASFPHRWYWLGAITNDGAIRALPQVPCPMRSLSETGREPRAARSLAPGATTPHHSEECVAGKFLPFQAGGAGVLSPTSPDRSPSFSAFAMRFAK
jgi:hypothetical protein